MSRRVSSQPPAPRESWVSLAPAPTAQPGAAADSGALLSAAGLGLRDRPCRALRTSRWAAPKGALLAEAHLRTRSPAHSLGGGEGRPAPWVRERDPGPPPGHTPAWRGPALPPFLAGRAQPTGHSGRGPGHLPQSLAPNWDRHHLPPARPDVTQRGEGGEGRDRRDTLPTRRHAGWTRGDTPDGHGDGPRPAPQEHTPEFTESPPAQP